MAGRQGDDEAGGGRWRVGDGNYSAVILTAWEGKPCVVKAIRRYCERVHNKRRRCRSKDLARAEREEAADVATEVCLLADASLDAVAPWRWRPHFFGHVVPQELEMVAQEAIHSAAGFEPGALLYMERLSLRLDVHLEEAGGTEEGAEEALALLCDCLAIVVGLQRQGLRHNDCMMRNVMLRRLPRRREEPRRLELRTVPGSLFEWRAHPELEVVLIDFGLASAGPSSPLRGKGVVTEETRNGMYANEGNGVRLSSGLHPLEMSSGGFARALIDLQCLAFNFQKLASQKRLHPLLARWCRQAYTAIDAAQREADLRGSPVCLETVVSTLMPPVASRSIPP